ncbi:hypothetical protein TKWG_22190 [Advenella kashmirensis WT001]|uniref:Uncharacterized protein n=1 Tax=Advenella kashmirensis (strain DSM 17095 / LMG 22695 / WT001) TaxID=1036672 RepID=I3UGF2_ADVKW|nr:hypothetical protein TKWG_22190 [Advenella kashmirensis WT001]
MRHGAKLWQPVILGNEICQQGLHASGWSLSVSMTVRKFGGFLNKIAQAVQVWRIHCHSSLYSFQ